MGVVGREEDFRAVEVGADRAGMRVAVEDRGDMRVAAVVEVEVGVRT